MSDAAQLLARRLEPTRLDRRRMEHIALAEIQDDGLCILGNKQPVFYGRGGNPDNARSQRVSPRWSIPYPDHQASRVWMRRSSPLRTSFSMESGPITGLRF